MKPGYLLSTDLMWISKVTGTAKELGYDVKALRKPEQLLEKVKTIGAQVLLFDLDSIEPDALTKLITEVEPICPCTKVAYGSHVLVPMLKAAREAGCGVVLTKGQMSSNLPQLLEQWFSETSTEASLE